MFRSSAMSIKAVNIRKEPKSWLSQDLILGTRHKLNKKIDEILLINLNELDKKAKNNNPETTKYTDIGSLVRDYADVYFDEAVAGKLTALHNSKTRANHNWLASYFRLITDADDAKTYINILDRNIQFVIAPIIEANKSYGVFIS